MPPRADMLTTLYQLTITANFSRVVMRAKITGFMIKRLKNSITKELGPLEVMVILV